MFSGLECFVGQMRRQRDRLVEILSPVSEFCGNSHPDKYHTIEKPVKQVGYFMSEVGHTKFGRMSQIST